MLVFFGICWVSLAFLGILWHSFPYFSAVAENILAVFVVRLLISKLFLLICYFQIEIVPIRSQILRHRMIRTVAVVGTRTRTATVEHIPYRTYHLSLIKWSTQIIHPDVANGRCPLAWHGIGMAR